MIPQSDIIEWSNHVPWSANEQVELDFDSRNGAQKSCGYFCG